MEWIWMAPSSAGKNNLTGTAQDLQSRRGVDKSVADTALPAGCGDRAALPNGGSLTPFSMSGAGASSGRRAWASQGTGVLPSLPFAAGRFTPLGGVVLP
jgi:hypothetical protein